MNTRPEWQVTPAHLVEAGLHNDNDGLDAMRQPDKTTSFNKLPVVITGPGEYLMRNGGKALIREVKEYEDPKGEFTRLEVTAFEAKGAPYKMFRGKMRARGLYIWHVSGRYSVFGENKWDIVSKAGE